jgi:hypothetical protein
MMCTPRSKKVLTKQKAAGAAHRFCGLSSRFQPEGFALRRLS